MATPMSQVENLQVQYLPASKIKGYARNSRTHSDAQVTQIAESMKEFGFVNPILIGEDGVIVAGHGRLAAAKLLGLKQVPTITLTGLSDTQRRALVIADNKLALNAGWDLEVLASEMDALRDLGVDMDLLGFEPEELNDLIGTDKLPPADEPKDGDVNFTVQYNIIFDDEPQQEKWFAFLKHLKNKYPDCETIGERLCIFINEGGYGES